MVRKDWNALVTQAQELIIKSQNATYPFLQEQMKLAPAQVRTLLGKLEGGGIVAHAANGTWVVLIAEDGVTRRAPPAELYAKKPKGRSKAKTTAKVATAKKTPVAKAAKSNGAAPITDAAKLAKLHDLKAAAAPGGHAHSVLSAIIDDFATIASARKAAKALA